MSTETVDPHRTPATGSQDSRAQPADSHDHIEVRGARENNLTGVSLDIPKRRLTVFTGVSGSGKSSLVFGTIAAESRRLINETYAAFIQSFMPAVNRPEVEELRNLSAAILVDQERMGANARSTVGTATDAYTMLRIIFSRLGDPYVGPSGAFSFNMPAGQVHGEVELQRGSDGVTETRVTELSGGMCPACEGLGTASDIDLNEVVDLDRSLNEGAIKVPGFAVDSWMWQVFIAAGFVDPDTPLGDLSPTQWDDLMHRPSCKVKVAKSTLTYEGLLPRVRKFYQGKDRDSLQPHIRNFVDRAVTFAACSACDGTRLNPVALSAKVNGANIAECTAMQISDLVEFLRAIDDPSVAPMVGSLCHTLDSLVEVGLGYLNLDRESSTLSGGEAQRVKMVRHLGSSLSDATYVFDEPTVGLHPHDIARMNDLLLRLRDKGNTVLVVEHKPEVTRIADHVVDLGPGAGTAGGVLCYTGDVAGLRESDTLTGRYLDHRVRLREQVRSPRGQMSVSAARTHNLKDVHVEIPVGVLTVVTGVAGSGKSSLIHGSVAPRDGVTAVDQSPIRGSRRSNPATYTGLLDPIRHAFAKANGVKPALFSANSKGACPNCSGAGVVYTDLAMMAGVAAVCEVCEGNRYTAEVLGYTLRGKNITEVLAMSVAQAQEFLTERKTRTILRRLNEVGLGYLRLGQPLNTLSGGERQRLKLAIHMAQRATTYVLDEPTNGLHLADINQLLSLLDRLVDDGNTVIVIEHHQAVMAHADWIVDLGPGAGHDGGQVVFTGTPDQLVTGGATLTANHLRQYVAL